MCDELLFVSNTSVPIEPLSPLFGSELYPQSLIFHGGVDFSVPTLVLDSKNTCMTCTLIDTAGCGLVGAKLIVDAMGSGPESIQLAERSRQMMLPCTTGLIAACEPCFPTGTGGFPSCLYGFGQNGAYSAPIQTNS